MAVGQTTRRRRIDARERVADALSNEVTIRAKAARATFPSSRDRYGARHAGSPF